MPRCTTYYGNSHFNEQGKGLGSQFYQAYESWVAQQEAQSVFLAVLQENQPGLTFWQKLGFEVIRIAPPQEFGNKIHRRYVLRRQVTKVNLIGLHLLTNPTL
ncbi:hypothetical protein FACHB389_23510 [Nostoc calcicola FACHB-389]|nr:GNAT family N-acetyltransferase [Nostoc calcicola FACHB-3891]OKH30579.1 hypothetical protein FACHB389_23510 [Nostoc calcicola FACHB-389]